MKEKILLYSQLPPDERADLEAHVEQNPDLRPLLDEAKALGDLFQEAQKLHADPPGDDMLAYYLATQHMSPHPAPEALQEVFSRIESRLQTDEALRARYNTLAQRMADLETVSDTVSHFERVTGHRIQPEREERPAPQPNKPRDRRPAPPPRRIGSRIMVVFGGALTIYLCLFIVSMLTVSPLDEAAAFEKDDVMGMGTALRSAQPGSPTLTNEERYEQALVLLREVRTSTLGLFPRYDATRLQTAGSLLEHVASQQAEGSPLQLEATYLLAKVRLAQHDVPAAREALAQVINSESDWRKTDAQALLESIHDQE